TKDVAEHVAENIAERVAARESGAATPPGGFDTRMAVLIVGRALVGVSENLAGLLGFLEALLRILVVGIAVGVILHRQAAVSLLDLCFCGCFGYVEYLVVIAFRHALLKPDLETPVSYRGCGHRYPTGFTLL